MNWKRLLRDVIVAVLSAILTFLTASCAGGIVIGHRNRQVQEVNASADSAELQLPSVTIYK